MKQILSIAALLFLFGCATPYSQNGLTGGYKETQIDENVWTVSFRGNGYTSPTRASDFTLLRCAEIAKENGFSYFVIVDSKEYSKTEIYNSPTRSRTSGTATVRGNNVDFDARTTTFGGPQVFTKPSTSNMIVCFEEKPETGGMVYNAEFIVKSLKEQYKIK